MFLQRVIHSEFGQYMIAIILGLGLASLFRPACNGENCYEFIGAPNKEVEKSVYKFDDECYQFQPKATTCQKQRKTLMFASMDSKQTETNTQPKSLITKLMNMNEDKNE
jgi:hypothetical protein